MKTIASSLVIVALGFLPMGGTAAAIPMFNGTCPGGIEVHADQGGPVFVNGREAQVKRFNDDYYEARDARSGVTLSISSSPGGVQVSYTGKQGANGVCTVGAQVPEADGGRSTHADRTLPPADEEVICESTDGRQVECPMDTHGDVRVVRQLSRARCEQNVSWGLYHHSVWVKDGCRAVFGRGVDDGRRSPSRMARAASPGDGLLGSCNARARAEGGLVTRVPVNDDVTELIVDYPDGRYLCMVRNDGLVQSLTRLRKQP